MATLFFRGFPSLLFLLCALFLVEIAAENDDGADDFLRPISPDMLHDINPSFAAKRSPDDFSVLDPLDSDVYIWGNPSNGKRGKSFIYKYAPCRMAHE